MSVSSTSAGTANSSASTSTSGTANLSNSFASLGPNAFLQLLTTQLANQDPMNPMDDTQSVAQLAQFSQLQASQNLQSSFASFNQNFGILQSAGLIGKTVTVNDTSSGGVQSGMVSAVDFSNGTPNFAITDPSGKPLGGSYSLSQILTIS